MESFDISDNEYERDVLFGVINRFIGYFTRETVAKTGNDTSYEYPFVAMDTRQAYAQLVCATSYLRRGAREEAQPRFLDIGCGIGNILLLAEMLGCDVYGIEKDQASLTIARQLVGDICVGEQDIWRFDDWDRFDIVYYFRPFCEKQRQLRFERLIEDALRPGAILIANRKMSDQIDRDSRFLRIGAELPVWYKVQKKEKAAFAGKFKSLDEQ